MAGWDQLPRVEEGWVKLGWAALISLSPPCCLQDLCEVGSFILLLPSPPSRASYPYSLPPTLPGRWPVVAIKAVGVRQAWVETLTLLFMDCVILDMSLTLSEPVSFSEKGG